MQPTALIVKIFAVAVLTTCAATAQQPEILTEIDRSRIYEGESVIFNVMVNHVDSPPEPTLDGFDKFDVELLGKQSQNSQQISIINGRRSEVIRRGMLFQYRISPKVSGAVTIPSPTVEIDGQKVSGRSLDLTVIPPQQQSTVILQVGADKESVYALQPFTVTLTLSVKQLPGELADISPLSIQRRARVKQAALTVPWLEDEQLSDRIEPVVGWNKILQPLMNDSSDGVSINGVNASNGGFLFGRSRDAVFLPKFEVRDRKSPDGEDGRYVEYKIKRKFVATRVGPIDFSACSIKGVFGTVFSDDGQLNVDEIYAVSNRFTVDVKAPPLDGRPDSYSGAIGQFDIDASLTPETAGVGDPLTLSLTVFGEGTIADIRAPDLSAIPELSDNFRVYEPTENTVENGKTFTYGLRAKNADVAEVPSIPFAFFDVVAEEYKSLNTPAIPVSISATQKLTASDIVAAAPSASSGSDVLEVNKSGLFANHSSLQSLRATSFSLKTWASVWGAMIAGYAVVGFGLRRRQKLSGDPSLLRKKNAKSRAAAQLKSLSVETGKTALLETMNKSVTGLIADYANIEDAGMTSTDASEHLTAAGIEPELAARTRTFLEDCDAARYGATQDIATGMLDRCRTLVADLGRELERHS